MSISNVSVSNDQPTNTVTSTACTQIIINTSQITESTAASVSRDQHMTSKQSIAINTHQVQCEPDFSGHLVGQLTSSTVQSRGNHMTKASSKPRESKKMVQLGSRENHLTSICTTTNELKQQIKTHIQSKKRMREYSSAQPDSVKKQRINDYSN